MPNSARPYIAFLVRLWQAGADDAWRASATDPHTGEQRLFADLAALYAFLQAATGKADGDFAQSCVHTDGEETKQTAEDRE